MSEKSTIFAQNYAMMDKHKQNIIVFINDESQFVQAMRMFSEDSEYRIVYYSACENCGMDFPGASGVDYVAIPTEVIEYTTSVKIFSRECEYKIVREKSPIYDVADKIVDNDTIIVVFDSSFGFKILKHYRKIAKKVFWIEPIETKRHSLRSWIAALLSDFSITQDKKLENHFFKYIGKAI